MIIQRLGRVAVAALALASCASSSDGNGAGSNDQDTTERASEADSDEEQASDGENDGDEAVAPASGSIAPVNGAVVSVLDLGLGLYGIDPDDGSSGEFSYDDEWYSDRQNQPVIVGDEALTIVYRQIDGELFSNDIALAAFDLTTGAGREVTALGNDRPDDESTNSTDFKLIGAAADIAWIATTASRDGEVVRRFSAHSIDTGETVGDYSPESVELASENSTCTFLPEPIAVDPDGALVVDFGGLPALVRPGAADVEELLDACSDADVTPLTLLGDDFDDFVVTDTGEPLPDAAAGRLLDFTPEISNNTIVTSDAAIWWLFSRTSTFSDGDIEVSAIIGGFARYDRSTGGVTLFDLGSATGMFLDPETSGGFTQTALTNADLQVLDGDLWIMDVRDDQPLRRLDPATGTIDEFVIPLVAVDIAGDAVEINDEDGPVDFVTSSLLATDPDGIWLEVSRRTVRSDDENGRTTTGAQFIEQIDPDSGAIIRSIPVGQLTGIEF